MSRIYITTPGMQKLKDELKRLTSVDRKAVIKAISDAREHGDLSENAEYHAAKERQSFLEGRIQYLQGLMPLLEAVDITRIKSDKVVFGATVKLYDSEADAEIVYQIVGEEEADIGKGLINIKSPIAKALIGKRVEDTVEVVVGTRKLYYDIMEIQYI